MCLRYLLDIQWGKTWVRSLRFESLIVKAVSWNVVQKEEGCYETLGKTCH